MSAATLGDTQRKTFSDEQEIPAEAQRNSEETRREDQAAVVQKAMGRPAETDHLG